MEKTYQFTAGLVPVAADLREMELSPEIIAEAMDINLRSIFRSGPADSHTFAQVFNLYYDYKCGQMDLSRQSGVSLRAAFKHLACFHDRTLDEVTVMELQNLVNDLARSYSKSTVANVIRLIRNLYRFALPRELCTKEYGLFIDRPRLKDEKHHEDFTDRDLAILWNHQADPVIRMVLVMCYTGFRVSAFEQSAHMKTILEDVRIPYLKGGVKTASGRNRRVPIHSAILPLIGRMDRNPDGSIIYLCGLGSSQFRRRMTRRLKELGIRPLTPHSTRHTFNRLLEKAGVSEADRKRLMGHSLKGDLINGVYGHRSLAELSAEIGKIRVPYVAKKTKIPKSDSSFRKQKNDNSFREIIRQYIIRIFGES